MGGDFSLDLDEFKFSKRELALSLCWLEKFLGLNIFQNALGQCSNLPGAAYLKDFGGFILLSIFIIEYVKVNQEKTEKEIASL